MEKPTETLLTVKQLEELGNKLTDIMKAVEMSNPALYELIIAIIENKIPKEEEERFLTLSQEDKKQWIIDWSKKVLGTGIGISEN
ncbi:TPA: hypothetical protein ACGOWI_001867 [Streptococcus suis]